MHPPPWTRRFSPPRRSRSSLLLCALPCLYLQAGQEAGRSLVNDTGWGQLMVALEALEAVDAGSADQVEHVLVVLPSGVDRFRPPDGEQTEALLLTHLDRGQVCLLYTSPSPRDGLLSRMPSSA